MDKRVMVPGEGGRAHEVDYDAAVQLMDDEIREQLHGALTPCEPQEFVDAYVAAHRAKHGASWVVN